MASGFYDSFFYDNSTGAIDTDTDTFYAMVLGAGYTFSKTHAKRSDLSSEVTGTGYTAGGQAVSLTVTKDTTNHRLDIATAVLSWASSTISGAQQLAIYKHRGGAASADELVACIDNGSTVSTTNGTLQWGANTLRIQN